MIDITQSMACIHCGACVVGVPVARRSTPSSSGRPALREGVPLRRRPARMPNTEDRLLDLAYDPHGIYDLHPLLRVRRGLPRRTWRR